MLLGRGPPSSSPLILASVVLSFSYLLTQSFWLRPFPSLIGVSKTPFLEPEAMAQFALCTLLLVYCSLVVAKPVNIHARGQSYLPQSCVASRTNKFSAVTPSILGNISLFEQYSAAAYCPSNNDGPATLNNTKRITCPISKNCPTVESHNATAIAEFQK